MKRIIIFTLLTLCAASLIFAQGLEDRRTPPPGVRENMQTTIEKLAARKVTVTGNLAIVKGMIALKNENAAYLLPGLMRYVGFIDNLKEGTQVTIEGTAIQRQPDSQVMVLLTNKLIIGGKEYEIGADNAASRMMHKQGQSIPNKRGQFRRQAPDCPCTDQPRQSPQKAHRR